MKFIFVLLVLLCALTGCTAPADVTSEYLKGDKGRYYYGLNVQQNYGGRTVYFTRGEFGNSKEKYKAGSRDFVAAIPIEYFQQALYASKVIPISDPNDPRLLEAAKIIKSELQLYSYTYVSRPFYPNEPFNSVMMYYYDVSLRTLAHKYVIEVRKRVRTDSVTNLDRIIDVYDVPRN